MAKKVCPICNGLNYVIVRIAGKDTPVTCPECNGTGEVDE